MPQAPQQQGQQPDSHMGILWIIAAIFVFGLIIWFFGHVYLASAFFALKRVEIAIIQFFIQGLENVKLFISMNDPSTVSFAQLATIAGQVGGYLRWPLSIIIAFLSILLFLKNSAVKFTHIYNMKELLEAEVVNWPQEIPVLKKDLIKEDIEQGAWAMAISPMPFAKKYNLIDVEKPSQDLVQLSIANKYKVTLRREKALSVFAQQLGALWQGVEALPPYTKALFAAFAAKASRDSDDSRNFLQQISRSAGAKLDFSGTEEFLKKYVNSKQVREVIEKHAYVLTVMASLLKTARLDGVLPSSEFLWLKPIDRRLWFMLNAVGRQTATIEVAGPFAHWRAEVELGEKIKTPMVECAVDGLEVALQEMIYKPDEKN